MRPSYRCASTLIVHALCTRARVQPQLGALFDALDPAKDRLLLRALRAGRAEIVRQMALTAAITADARSRWVFT